MTATLNVPGEIANGNLLFMPNQMFCSTPKGGAHTEQGMWIWVAHSSRCLDRVAWVLPSKWSLSFWARRNEEMAFSLSLPSRSSCLILENLCPDVRGLWGQPKQQLAPGEPLPPGVLHQISWLSLLF